MMIELFDQIFEQIWKCGIYIHWTIAICGIVLVLFQFALAIIGNLPIKNKQ
jgi:hypothetical protein